MKKQSQILGRRQDNEVETKKKVGGKGKPKHERSYIHEKRKNKNLFLQKKFATFIISKLSFL